MTRDLQSASPGTSLGKYLAVLRRPYFGPILIGLVFGGIPSGVILGRLGIYVVTPELFRLIFFLSPLAFLVSTIAAMLGARDDRRGLFIRAFLASFSCCVPLPISVCTYLLWRSGYEPFAAGNFPALILMLGAWGTVVTVSSWLLALGLNLLRKLRSSGPRISI